MLITSISAANPGKMEKSAGRGNVKMIVCVFFFGSERGGKKGISERLLENDSLCYSSSDSLADSYQEEREVSTQRKGENIPLSLSLLPLLLSPPPSTLFPKA